MRSLTPGAGLPWDGPARRPDGRRPSDSPPRAARGVPRGCPVGSGQLLNACRLAWERGGRLAALWASDERDRSRGFARQRRRSPTPTACCVLEYTLPDGRRRLSRPADDLPRREPDAARRVRPGRRRLRQRRPAPVAVAGELADRPVPAAARLHRVAEVGARRGGLPVRPRRGRRRARDSGRARCTPASSSRGISASRSSARRCCGSRSGSATCTRASRSASSRCRSPTATGSPAASPATAPSPTRGPTRRRPRRSPASPCRRARAWLRALALERERIANHLGDLGYLGNDGGFAFGLAQFSRLKEDVLRANAAAFGHRLLMDFVVPGGVARDVAPDGARRDARRGAIASSASSACCATSTTTTPGCRIASAPAASSAPSSRRGWA